MPHYDLTPSKHLQALQAGAHELPDNPAIVTVIKAWRAFQAAKQAIPQQARLAL